MMKTYINPDINKWSEISKRPEVDLTQLNETVLQVFNEVKINGDKAVLKYTKFFDRCKLNELKVSKNEIKSAKENLKAELKSAIKTAKNNIEKFHKSQIVKEKVVETMEGVKCWRENKGIEKVGIYIPGGTAPLFSTVLMLGIPAKLAHCKEIILCTPPNEKGEVNPAILYTANLLGITKIFKVGGIQAIAGMTFGTETIPNVYKIFGPGNQYVTAAKQNAQNFGVAIDMPAGPSEVLVIADKKSNPDFIAADLLSQAEHGADSQVILVTDSLKKVKQVKNSIKNQLKKLPRKEIAIKALEKSSSIVLKNENEMMSFSNFYGPEHLIISTVKARKLAKQVVNAGSVFIGEFTPESAGDYASGTNHTLPTNGYARNYSGVSVDSFMRKVTFQEINRKGIQNLGKTIEIMAEAELLDAHKNAVSVRLKTLKK